MEIDKATEKIIYWLLIIFIIFNCLDLALTFVGVNMLGFPERNLVFKELIENGNFAIPFIFKIFAMAIIVLFVSIRKITRWDFIYVIALGLVDIVLIRTAIDWVVAISGVL